MCKAPVPEALQAEMEDLKSDKLRLERKVEKLTKDLEEKKKEIEALKVTRYL
jgi:predicted  nucleic acid-binding Zn-ribbon protein